MTGDAVGLCKFKQSKLSKRRICAPILDLYPNVVAMSITNGSMVEWSSKPPPAFALRPGSWVPCRAKHFPFPSGPDTATRRLQASDRLVAYIP
jgi:hypothetical protein